VNDVPPSSDTQFAESVQPQQVESEITAHSIKNDPNREFGLAVLLTLLTALVFYFSTKPIFQNFDYTARGALALMKGHLSVQASPPSSSNEIIPANGGYYLAFPLGAILSVVPVAVLQKLGWIHNFPARIVAALIAGFCAFFFFRLSSLEAKPLTRRILLAVFPIFGTWFWCNLGLAGAGQLALGFAVLGELGALYFTLIRPRPLIAGAFFALAFGNRTELILTLPIYLYFLSLHADSAAIPFAARMKVWFRQNWRPLSDFLILPLALGLVTAAYNYARFGSFFDFGHARSASALHEPWYRYGFFSVQAIPGNIRKMFLEGFNDRPDFPFFRFDQSGCSIFLSSPFLCLIFREGGRFRRICWIVIAILTAALWMQGNPSTPEFSYGSAMILLPWMFVLLAGNGPAKLSVIEISLFVVSVAINAIATWQFLWTQEIHP
jgi:hypothetical protein